MQGKRSFTFNILPECTVQMYIYKYTVAARHNLIPVQTPKADTRLALYLLGILSGSSFLIFVSAWARVGSTLGLLGSTLGLLGVRSFVSL